ncbi:MAG: SIMPL domain-containing protein [Deltaproteobacteria bacterium]|nr:SIMPL domain-containing protein [Deltaproteobacteria bacterium]
MHGIMRRGVVVFVLILAFSFSACAADKPGPRLITVTGDAEVRVAPDEVILTFGVETWDKDLAIAKRQNDKWVQKVLALAKKYKIEPKHVQTDHISIEPRYKDGYTRENFIGYFVRKTIVFRLRDISKFEDLLSSALEAGANYVHGVQFRTTKLREYRDQARALAIRAAKEKAKDLAKELGQKIGKPHTIREEHSGWWHWYNSWWGSRWGGGRRMAQNVMQNVSGGPLETGSSIALGQISVNARVRVSFELK